MVTLIPPKTAPLAPSMLIPCVVLLSAAALKPSFVSVFSCSAVVASMACVYLQGRFDFGEEAEVVWHHVW